MSEYTVAAIAVADRQFRDALEGVADQPSWLDLKGRMLGRERGIVTALMATLRDLPRDEKRAFGREINIFKKDVEARLGALQEAIAERSLRATEASRQLDPTVPGWRVPRGRRHPVSLVREEIEAIFARMGYEVVDGPEVEDDHHNFEALNIPPDHPARDDQDTFFLQSEDASGRRRVLRTHTSPVQIRLMESRTPPFRAIIPGRTYRRDSGLRYSPMFHQVEGLVVGPDISFAHLRATLEVFTQALFTADTKVRFRPSYFPFVEPGAEVDISCIFCAGRGENDAGRCRVCSATGWLEILGAGMVDPRVFAAIGRPEYDSEKVTGFAFGLGMDRVAMLKYKIPDLRLMFTGDLRVTEQFS